MSRFFRKMYAQCRLFVNKRETFYIQKCGENGIFAYKNRENDVFFPKKAQKSDLSGSRVVYPCCFLLRVRGLQQSHTLKSARGMMFSASKVYYYNKNKLY